MKCLAFDMGIRADRALLGQCNKKSPHPARAGACGSERNLFLIARLEVYLSQGVESEDALLGRVPEIGLLVRHAFVVDLVCGVEVGGWAAELPVEAEHGVLGGLDQRVELVTERGAVVPNLEPGLLNGDLLVVRVIAIAVVDVHGLRGRQLESAFYGSAILLGHREAASDQDNCCVAGALLALLDLGQLSRLAWCLGGSQLLLGLGQLGVDLGELGLELSFGGVGHWLTSEVDKPQCTVELGH